MTERERFREAILLLWKTGQYPSPTALNLQLHGRRSNNLNGRESKWRREAMTALGIPLQRPGGARAARRQSRGLPPREKR